MPKATLNIVFVSPYHNHSAGDLADQLGTLKAEIAALEDREKSLRDELIRRGGAEIEGTVYRATISGALDARCQSRARRNGRCVVESAVPATAGDDGCR